MTAAPLPPLTGEHLLGRFVAAVVDDVKRQAVHDQIRHSRANRVLVVIDRDHDAGSVAHAGSL
jgi:hypothetical protein